MLGGKVFSLIIDKEMIEKGNILEVVRAIGKMEMHGIDAFQKIAIAFHGYDDSTVEVWEVKEIRDWCHKLINKIPYLFYYIENEYFQSQQTLMICLNDYSSVYAGERLPIEEIEKAHRKGEDVPQHEVKLHIHQKSFRTMFAEIRKHARKLGKMKNAEKVIKEMSGRYGISTD